MIKHALFLWDKIWRFRFSSVRVVPLISKGWENSLRIIPQDITPIYDTLKVKSVAKSDLQTVLNVIILR